MTLRLAIFDCDGTLADSEASIVQAVRAAFADHGLALPARAQIVSNIGLSLGSFLDQVSNHVTAGHYARGRGLDVFTYHGGFALQLARACERVLVVDDGPTLTHGGMPYGAGYVAARAAGAAELIDPRAAATPGLRAVFDAHPHLGTVLPAMGYGEVQMRELAETIRNTSGKRFFLAGNQGHAPSTDFYLCLDLNRFNFVLKAEPLEPGILSLKKINHGYSGTH